MKGVESDSSTRLAQILQRCLNIIVCVLNLNSHTDYFTATLFAFPDFYVGHKNREFFFLLVICM